MENVLEIRKALGLSQREMAKELGLIQSTLSRFERGNRDPDRRTLLACQYLRIRAILDANPNLGRKVEALIEASKVA